MTRPNRRVNKGGPSSRKRAAARTTPRTYVNRKKHPLEDSDNEEGDVYVIDKRSGDNKRLIKKPKRYTPPVKKTKVYISNRTGEEITKQQKLSENVRESETIPLTLPQEIPSREKLEAQYPFCCAKCTCNKGIVDNYVQSNDFGLYHRACCHKILQNEGVPTEWLSPVEKALAEWGECIGVVEPKPEPARKTWEDLQALKSLGLYQRETQVFNDDYYEAVSDKLRTSEKYNELSKKFEQMPARTEPATVLMLFDGIGAGTEVLKRLQIDIGKIIHVEHDLVARFVTCFRQNTKFVEELKRHYDGTDDCSESLAKLLQETTVTEDTITHVYYRKFEKVFNGTKINPRFVEKHLSNGQGIDIVVGGPPCTDHSKVNAFKSGVDGEEGRYLVEAAHMIQLLQEHQKDRPVSFLLENVVLDSETRNEVNSYLGMDWDPVRIDSGNHSPCCRNRDYFTNIPLALGLEEDIDTDPATCLDDGYQHCGVFLGESNMTQKINCFMASKARLDDIRMTIYKKCIDVETNDDYYLERCPSAAERERMMGLRVGYVEKPVLALFEELYQNGYSRVQQSQWTEPEKRNKSDWRCLLPGMLHNFAGNFLNESSFDRGFPFKFYVDKTQDMPSVRLKLAYPPTGRKKQLKHMTATDYALHLIGNSFSIPVVQCLLSPLQSKFPRRTYPGYDYDFAWKRDARPILSTNNHDFEKRVHREYSLAHHGQVPSSTAIEPHTTSEHADPAPDDNDPSSNEHDVKAEEVKEASTNPCPITTVADNEDEKVEPSSSPPITNDVSTKEPPDHETGPDCVVTDTDESPFIENNSTTDSPIDPNLSEHDDDEKAASTAAASVAEVPVPPSSDTFTFVMGPPDPAPNSGEHVVKSDIGEAPTVEARVMQRQMNKLAPAEPHVKVEPAEEQQAPSRATKSEDIDDDDTVVV